MSLPDIFGSRTPDGELARRSRVVLRRLSRVLAGIGRCSLTGFCLRR